MSHPVWPATLPQGALPGWTDDEAAQFETFKVDVGPSKRRRRTTRGQRSVQIPLDLSGAQLATFNTFYQTTLEGGTLPFDWTNGDPATDATITYRFVKRPQFRSWLPSPTASKRRYEATLDLEEV